ncbi:hypothetical protein [Aquibacillus sediminis]|uniref:hypothetical protein n=1 Tax=Aquibacillus sediminis TaxID=2574734 RepID=UPI001109F2DD|nr:hypothetical protein [Aquibacillus sediminis]
MNFKSFVQSNPIVIIIACLIIIAGFILITQQYFNYIEVKNMVDKCYDKGGLPTIERSGLQIAHFSCEYKNKG